MSLVAGPEMMAEDVELEEGEALYFNSNDDKSIDPDVALSYIDDKLQSVLGHFQKDFQGGAWAEKLGAIFGGYGSFLPMHQRSPLLLSQQKSPHRIQSNIARSPNLLHREGGVRSFSSIPDVTGGPYVTYSVHDEKVNLGDDVHRKEFELVAKKLPPRYEPSPNKSVNVTDQKSLKFRIKVGLGNASKKNVAAIYSGLGLNSPSSSHGNSPAGSVGVPSESPTRILQMLSTLTDALVPLLSPLPDSCLNLLRDVPMGGKDDKLHLSSTFGVHSDSKVDDEVINRTKKMTTTGECELVQEGNVLLRLKENSGAQTLDFSMEESQKLQSERTNSYNEPLSNSSKQLSSLKGIEKVSLMKNTKLDNSSNKRRLLGSDVVKDKSLDSVAGQDGNKFKHQEVNGRTFSSKMDSDTFESGRESKGGLIRVTSHVQEKSRMPEHVKKTPLESKKKSKLTQTNGKLPLDSMNEGTDAGEKKSGKKVIFKARDLYEDLFGSSVDPLEKKPSNDGSKGSIDTVKNEILHKDRLKSKTNLNKVDNQQTSESLLPHDNGLPLDIEQTNRALGTEQTALAPLGIEDWVQCDRCEQWRLLPYGRKPDQLPDKWLCSMLDWLPGMNRCDISEDETTTALQASYQLPLADDQYPNDRVVKVVNSMDGPYGYTGKSNVVSGNVANESNNKHKVKGISHKGSKQQESPEDSESLNARKPIGNSIGSNRNGSHNAVEKHLNNQKPEHLTRGEMKVKRKSKGVDYQYEQPFEKKVKIGQTSDINHSPISSGSLGKNEIYSSNPSLSAMASLSDKRNSVDHSHTKDSKPAEVRNQVDDNTLFRGSLDMKRSSESHMSLKKRKLMDWQNSQSHIDAMKNEGKIPPLVEEDSDSGVGKIKKPSLVKEDSDSGVGRIKKPMNLQSNGTLSSKTKVNDDMTQKDPVSRLIAVPGSGSIHDKDLEKEKVLKEHKVKVASQLTKVNLESLKKALTSEQVPTMATSSSSKVSDSNKTQTRRIENRGSPVDSVSSYPLRISTTVDKHSRNPIKFKNDKTKSRRPTNFNRSETSNNHELSFLELGDVGNLVGCNGFLEPNHHEPLPEPSFDKDKERSSNHNPTEPPDRVLPPRDRQRTSKPKKNSRVMPEIDQTTSADKLYNNNRHGSLKSSEKKENGLKWEHQNSIVNPKDSCPPDDFRSEKPRASHHSREKNEISPINITVIPEQQKKNPSGEISRELKDLGKAIHKSESLNGSTEQTQTEPNFSKSNGSVHYASVLQEAEDLRDYADRLKDTGFVYECNETYFQAALKFLQGASLLESSRGSKKHDEIYISSAKLFETSGEEYERRQEMAAAALAYKCVEVAYMRVVYCKNVTVNRSYHDLRSSLLMVPQGESPASSASDMDNLNNHALVDKSSLSKSNGTLLENHILATRSRSSFARLLDFTKYVNLAMEASMKYQNALATANIILEEAQNKDGIVSVKRVVDFNFQDVEEFVRLIGLAKEAINRKALCGSRN